MKSKTRELLRKFFERKIKSVQFVGLVLNNSDFKIKISGILKIVLFMFIPYCTVKYISIVHSHNCMYPAQTFAASIDVLVSADSVSCNYSLRAKHVSSF